MASRTYTSYLALDELLRLQRPVSEGPEHDEMLFIVIHQVYELWFKQMLQELRHLTGLFDASNGPAALHTLNRIRTILKVLVAQVDILETMTPVSFASFRTRLEAASGFQSAQFREIEFVLGHRDAAALDRLPEGSEARERLAARLREPPVWVHFLRYLKASGYPVPAEALAPDLTAGPQENAEVQRILLDVYRKDPAVAQVCERLVDIDEGLQEWRYRHVKMVERTIGSKPGTGGSAGAAYLKKTLFLPLFPDLWAMRSAL